MLIVLCGAAFSLYSELMPPPWNLPELDAGEIRLSDALALDVIWIDARRKTEYDIAHIPGALLLNESNWDAGIGNFLETWLDDMRPVIVYCDGDQCNASKQIAQQLREILPEAEVYSLKGGWDAWVK